MNAAIYESIAAIFSSSLPICPIYFHLVMPRHVWMGIMGRLEEKMAAVLLYWLHSFALACLMFPGPEALGAAYFGNAPGRGAWRNTKLQNMWTVIMG
jgi:hypothetical protein